MITSCDNVIESADRPGTPKGYNPHYAALSHTGAAALPKYATMITIKCECCGRDVTDYRCRNRRFCSNRVCVAMMARNRLGSKHHHWVKRKKFQCGQCGETVLRKPDAAKRNRRGMVFCDCKCSMKWTIENIIGKRGAEHPGWLGGNRVYRGTNWQEARAAALKRDGMACVKCGKKTNIVHHKRPFRLFATPREANDLTNLQTLCKNCHGKAEAEFWDVVGRTPTDFAKNREIECKRCWRMFTPKKIRCPERYCPECREYKACEVCGKRIEITNRRSNRRNVKYCSKSCGGKAKWESLSRWQKENPDAYRRQQRIAAITGAGHLRKWNRENREQHLIHAAIAREAKRRYPRQLGAETIEAMG